MNNQTLHELNEAISLNPENATTYLKRGDAYLQQGDYDRAIEDFDNTVRLCPNYETDYIDSKFAHGGEYLVERAIELLDSVINTPHENAIDFYYAGVRGVFLNDRLFARRYFELALKLGYDDREKVKQHLENLKNRK